MPRTLQMTGVFLSLTACLPLVVPPALLGAELVPASSGPREGLPVVRDIALGPQGELAGQLLDAEGRPRVSQVVVVQRAGQTPVQATTDREGRFQVRGLTGGSYQVSTRDSAAACRCWQAQSAPPAARRELLLVSGEGVQRAQRPFGEMLFSAPVLIGLVIAAAVAIPIAVHNSQDDAS